MTCIQMLVYWQYGSSSTDVVITSDNGKNFVGTYQEAKRFDDVFDVARIKDDLSTKGIDCQSNSPHNPVAPNRSSREMILNSESCSIHWVGYFADAHVIFVVF